jgi:formamidopyrimidine-DNA glycosylase
VPEGLEAEIWRAAIEVTVGRTIADAWADERVAPPGFAPVVRDATISAVRRAGKVVLIDTDGPTIGLHFGMTGRVVVDGRAPIERLSYASGRDEAEWNRLCLWTGVPGQPPAVRFNDPRRFGHISLDPDVSALGPDMFEITPSELQARFGRRRTSIKAVLLDQHVVAGLGNLCVDEVLWWAGIAPDRAGDRVTSEETRRLVLVMRRRLRVMLRRGGSTTGVIDPRVRAELTPCPRDGVPLRRAQVGGRTTVWCAAHQR